MFKRKESLKFYALLIQQAQVIRDAVEALRVRADETAVSDALMAICTLSDAAGVDAETALRAGIGRLIASLEAKTEKKD